MPYARKLISTLSPNKGTTFIDNLLDAQFSQDGLRERHVTLIGNEAGERPVTFFGLKHRPSAESQFKAQWTSEREQVSFGARALSESRDIFSVPKIWTPNCRLPEPASNRDIFCQICPRYTEVRDAHGSDIFQVRRRHFGAGGPSDCHGAAVTFRWTFGARIPANSRSTPVTSLTSREPRKASINVGGQAAEL